MEHSINCKLACTEKISHKNENVGYLWSLAVSFLEISLSVFNHFEKKCTPTKSEFFINFLVKYLTLQPCIGQSDRPTQTVLSGNIRSISIIWNMITWGITSNWPVNGHYKRLFKSRFKSVDPACEGQYNII